MSHRSRASLVSSLMSKIVYVKTVVLYRLWGSIRELTTRLKLDKYGARIMAHHILRQWVTFSFAETEVSSISLRPKSES